MYFTRVTTAKEPFVLGAWITGGARKGRTWVQRQGIWLRAVGQGLEWELTGESKGVPPPCAHLSMVCRCAFLTQGGRD